MIYNDHHRGDTANTSLNSIESGNTGCMLSTIKSTSTIISSNISKQQKIQHQNKKNVGKSGSKTIGEASLSKKTAASNGIKTGSLHISLANDKKRNKQESFSSEDNELPCETPQVDESLTSDIHA